jgi:hypothetical protein
MNPLAAGMMSAPLGMKQYHGQLGRQGRPHIELGCPYRKQNWC